MGFLNVSDKDWTVAVLGPEAEGAYRCLASGGGMGTQQEAKRALLAELSDS